MKKRKVNFKNKSVLVFLTVILCCSIVLTAMPTVKADAKDPILTGPYNINMYAFKYYTDLKIENLTEIDAYMLVTDVPIQFRIDVPAIQGAHYTIHWGQGDGTTSGDFPTNLPEVMQPPSGRLYAYPSHAYSTSGWRDVYVEVTYDSDGPYYSQSIPVGVNGGGIPALQYRNGHAINGPFTGSGNTWQTANPDDLDSGTLYYFRVHTYHKDYDDQAYLSYYYDDYNVQHTGLNTGYGVVYRFVWGDNTYSDSVVLLDGDIHEDIPAHSWTAGNYCIAAYAGWYSLAIQDPQHPQEQDITWSNPDYLQITVNDPPPTYEVSTAGYDIYYYNQVFAPIWVDSGYGGVAGQTLYISEGGHTITVDSTWDNHAFAYFSTSNGDYYSNQIYFTVSSNSWITVYYWL